MTTPRNFLYVRRGRLASGLWDVAAYGDDSVADGTVVEGEPEQPGEPFWSVGEASPGLLHVEVGREVLPERPDLWFVSVDEPRASPAATNLVAFGGGRFPAGTVISQYTFATARVPNGEQAGAVRWYPRDGLVHQIFVSPSWRRQFVASTLLYTADAVHQAKGWAGKVHADGRRTALGQVLAAGLRHPNRARALTEEMPPMDAEALGRARE